MGIEEIEKKLPNGLHDAVMQKYELNYATGTIVFYVDVSVGNLESSREQARERYRPGVLMFEGLEYFIVEPPCTSEAVIEPFLFSAGNPETEGIKPGVPLPAHSEGSFRVYFYVYRLNAFVHICAKSVSFEYCA